MTDYTRDALEWLRDVATLHRKGWLKETARVILAHIADLEARAKEAEAKVAAAEERGLVFNTLPDGRLDFCAIREGSRLWDGRVRAEAAEAREATLRETAEPFARHAKFYAYDPEEEIFCATVLVGSTGEKHRLTVGDLRRLAQALDAAPAAPSEPVYKAVERILDEESAWVARPSPEVTRRIALAVTIAAFQAHGVEAANAVRVAKLERLLREARADVEYIADAESGSAEGAASRNLLADIDAALAEAEGLGG